MVLQEGYLVSGKAASAEELPHGGHHQDDQGEVDAGEGGVCQGLAHTCLGGVFSRTEAQQVHGDDGQVQAHHLIGAGQIGVHQHVRRGNKGGSDQHPCGQSCALGYELREEAHHQAAQQHHCQHRKADGQSGAHVGGQGQGRAGAQEQDQDRVCAYGLKEFGAVFSFVHPFPLL